MSTPIDHLPSTTIPPNREVEHHFVPVEGYEHTYEATLEVSEPTNAFEHIKRAAFGAPIPQRLANLELLNRARALAILSSDALSSVAYGTEASLAVLIAAGTGALRYNLGIGFVIIALMAIVASSYRQTINAYPGGGGSYIVASQNLTPTLGLIAAAALLIDYILTVAVSVSAGIDALASAIPAIQPYTLGLDLLSILFITYINMRGLSEAAKFFAIPTYIFLGSFGLMLLLGIIHAVGSGGLFTAAPVGAAAPDVLATVQQSLAQGTQSLTVLLVLTAFASGCSAMTGVEAISNSVPVFQGNRQEEQAKNASSTLVVMIILLIALFFGTNYLAWRIGTLPSPNGQPTITSQIATYAYVGWLGGWLRPLYYVVQFATFAILIFAANTSFAGFPRLCAILARDEYMPTLFQYRGERIAFNVGIGTLGIVSALIIWVFRGRVTELINLYALGVFTAFTLSQAGMVVHWARRQMERGWRRRQIINGIGAVATAIVAAVIAITKFDRGGWVVVVLIPVLVFFFKGIGWYYKQPRIIHQELLNETRHFDVILTPIFSHRRIVTALPEGERLRLQHQHLWPAVIDEELRYVGKLQPGRVIVLAVVFSVDEIASMRHDWSQRIAEWQQQLGFPVQLDVIVSPYRTVVQPVANFIRDQCEGEFKDQILGVVIPQEIHAKWWEVPLRRFTAQRVARMVRDDDVKGVEIIDLPFTIGA